MATRTKKQKHASAMKGARTRKRNSSVTPRKRRRPAKKKGFLNDITGVEGKNAFRTLVSGTIGGGLYLVYEDQVDLGTTATPEKKALFGTIGAFAIALMAKKPNVGAGVMGAVAYDFFKTKELLGDPADVQMSRVDYADPLSNIPTTLSENGMYLAQTGEYDLADTVRMDEQGESYYPDYYASYNEV